MQRTRYQNGCLVREKRKSGPAVWIFRYRDAQNVHRKHIVGTVEEYKTKADAKRATEQLRVNLNINNPDWRPVTVAELVEHYITKEFPRLTPYTCEVYQGYLDKWILPKWGERKLLELKPVPVQEWLASLPLANGTRAKLRNLLSGVLNHAMRYEFIRAAMNPMKLVRQSAKREKAPEVLDATEIKAILERLTGPYKVMVFVAAGTGLRVSELLGLKWQDFNFDAELINLERGVVRQHIGGMKTEASRKPLPLSVGLAEVLRDWRAETPYAGLDDWVFPSLDKSGKQPLWANSAMEKRVRPAAESAGIKKRVGWHTFRHSFATMLKANNEDVKTVQESLRHATSKITLECYTQGVMTAKRDAQSKVIEAISTTLFPSVPTTQEANTASI